MVVVKGFSVRVVNVQRCVSVLCLLFFIMLGQLLHAESSAGDPTGSFADGRWLKFLGRLHVVVLHMPIGILFMAALFECATLCRMRLIDTRAQMLMWIFGSASAMIAVLFGLLLSQEEEELSDSLFWHMWLGIAAFAWSIILIYFYRRCNRVPSVAAMASYRFSVVACVVCVLLAGHKGGEVTHGAHYIDKYAPWTEVKRTQPKLHNSADAGNAPESKVTVEQVADSSEALLPSANGETMEVSEAVSTEKASERLANIQIYVDHIVPILKDRCYECHGERKRKSGLRLDSPQFIMQGGKNGEIVVAGQPELSTLYTLTVLDEDDLDIMPSKGKPLKQKQTEQMYKWILGGAHFDVPVVVQKKEKIIDTRQDRSEVESSNIVAPNKKDIALLQARGIKIDTLSSNGALLDVEVRFLKGTLTNADRKALESISKNIRWLDCGRTTAGDNEMSIVAQCTQLQRLMLHETQVTDKGLAMIKGLKDLEVLNVYKTAITDTGLQQLYGMKNLQKIYLWQTKTTAAGRAALQKKLPKVKIISGD